MVALSGWIYKRIGKAVTRLLLAGPRKGLPWLTVVNVMGLQSVASVCSTLVIWNVSLYCESNLCEDGKKTFVFVCEWKLLFAN